MTRAIARITSILCIPYGYTVTLWCAGAIPVLVALVVAALPLRVVGKPLAFVTASVVATLAYIVNLAALVRSTSAPDA